MVKANRLYNITEPFAALFWALSNVLAQCAYTETGDPARRPGILHPSSWHGLYFRSQLCSIWHGRRVAPSPPPSRVTNFRLFLFIFLILQERAFFWIIFYYIIQCFYFRFWYSRKKVLHIKDTRPNTDFWFCEQICTEYMKRMYPTFPISISSTAVRRRSPIIPLPHSIHFLGLSSVLYSKKSASIIHITEGERNKMMHPHHPTEINKYKCSNNIVYKH